MLTNRAYLFVFITKRDEACTNNISETASAAQRDLPQGDQQLPLRVGRRDLRLFPLRRQHRKGTSRLGVRRHPPASATTGGGTSGNEA
jgi:hypothetical protein